VGITLPFLLSIGSFISVSGLIIFLYRPAC